MEPGEGTVGHRFHNHVRTPNVRYTLDKPGREDSWYLRAAPQQQGSQAATTPHQGLDAILRDLITPRQVQVLQVPTALTGEQETKPHVCSPSHREFRTNSELSSPQAVQGRETSVTRVAHFLLQWDREKGFRHTKMLRALGISHDH